METDRILEIIELHAGERGALISILEEVQATYGYLPAHALETVADRTGRSLVDIYRVATFYRAFSLKPRGRHLLTCCVGTACHVRGAPRVVQVLQRQLGVRPGDTTADREFTFETQNCLGGARSGRSSSPTATTSPTSMRRAWPTSSAGPTRGWTRWM